MNFGLARSMGFLGYSLSAAVMGMLTSHFGPEVIIPVYALIYLILIGVLISFPVPQKDLDAHIIAGNDLIQENPSTIKEFIRKYHRFIVLIIGFSFLWFMNNLITTFMIYFIEPLGGTSKDLGLTLFLMAFSEIPAVMFGKNIMSHIGAPAMLRISALGGVLKLVLFFATPNITFWIWLNVSHILLSGFYQVSSVYYSYAIVGEKDIVKGQAIMGIFVTGICSMLANSLGGWMLESISIKGILFIGIFISMVAFAIIYFATSAKHFKNEVVRTI